MVGLNKKFVAIKELFLNKLKNMWEKFNAILFTVNFFLGFFFFLMITTLIAYWLLVDFQETQQLALGREIDLLNAKVEFLEKVGKKHEKPSFTIFEANAINVTAAVLTAVCVIMFAVLKSS